MKNIFAKAAAVLTCGFVLINSTPVYGAANPVISLKSDKVAEGDTQVTVSCTIENGADVTNGKLRIKYDGDAMKLESASAGEGLSGAMCEINDCLTGNKQEGELVAAFAAASPLKQNGSMVDMSFDLSGEAKAGTEFEVTVDVEELAGDGKDLKAEVKSLTITVEEAEEEPDDQNPGTDDGDDEQNGDKDSGKDDGKDSGEDDNDKDGTGKDEGSSGKDDGKGSQNDKNTGKGDKTSSGSSSKTSKSGKVKTGDETSLLIPAATGGIALISIGAVLLWKKKKGSEV